MLRVCLMKQFAICLGVFAILLLNVMDLFSVVGGALLDRPCIVFHRMYVLRLPYVLFVFECWKLSPHLGA